METKVCSKCNIKKDVTEFYSSRKKCKTCIIEYQREYNQNNKEKRKKYLKENKEKISKKGKEYYQKNKEKRKKYTEKNKEKRKKYLKENKEKINEQHREYYKEYYQNNKEKINERKREYYRKRIKYDTFFKIKERITDIIRKSIKNNGYTKKSNTYTILGCSYEDFKEHIESNWEDWMSWDNYGNPKDGVLELNKTWDLDHIVPVSSAQCEEDVYKLNHYSNIQPLCSYINRNVKRDNIDWKS